MTYAEWFYLTDAGQGRWVVRHAISDEIAGTITRVPTGFVLSDADTAQLGVFPSTTAALRELYLAA